MHLRHSTNRRSLMRYIALSFAFVLAPAASLGAVTGDLDGDNDVDLADFATFSLCFGATVGSPPPACSAASALAADLDGSGVIALNDFATFSAAFGFCTDQIPGFGGGDGTPADPYLVCKPAHLDNVRHHLDAHFRQPADIDMSSFGVFDPIGSFIDAFTGTYDGAGHAIDRLTIVPTFPADIGLFSTVWDTALIRDLTLTSPYVAGTDHVGSLVGYNIGTLERVAVLDCTVIAAGLRVGGICGVSTGTITESRATGHVTGRFRIGGLAGELTGLVSTLADSYAQVRIDVPAGGNTAGGLVGQLRSPAAVTNCYSTGLVAFAGPSSGGLAGLNLSATVTAAYWDTQTSGQPTSPAGTGLSTAQMQMQSTFDPPWDFTNTWMIDEGNDYPRLRNNN